MLPGAEWVGKTSIPRALANPSTPVLSALNVFSHLTTKWDRCRPPFIDKEAQTLRNFTDSRTRN